MPTFQLYSIRPRRRIATIESEVNPRDTEACVALLRRLAAQHGHKPSEVVMFFTGGRRVLQYRA